MKDLDVSLEFLDFPPAHTCSGENSSPRITLKGLDCTSVAILVYNPSIRNCYSFASWVIWNIPPLQVIPAGIPHGKIVSTPVSAMQGTNDAGVIGYTGPCPPVGEMHRYIFRVYGLDDLIELSGGSTKYQLTAAMHDHIVQYGETEGAYGR
jgi:Raf kinase inhibitor-like YbhB/YbcL family protein